MSTLQLIEHFNDAAAKLSAENIRLQEEVERLNARLKVVRDQYNGDATICHELMKEALGDERKQAIWGKAK